MTSHAELLQVMIQMLRVQPALLLGSHLAEGRMSGRFLLNRLSGDFGDQTLAARQFRTEIM